MNQIARVALLAALISFIPYALRAADEPVRLDLRLMGADLTDEMAYTWLRSPPFQGPMSLIVAEIEAPIGIDTRFAQDIENHLYDVLRANPNLPLTLVHCSLCRQWVAVSGPKRTVFGSALNQPGLADELRAYPHLHALSMHFDVVAEDLVLWAEIYEVAPPQRVVWSRRYSFSTSARAVLREPNKLIGIDEAREEQRRLLLGRDSLQTVTRFPIRTFASQQDSQIPPLIFLEQSFEAILAPHRNRDAALSLGVTSIKDSLQGWSVGARFQQLLFRQEPSLTNPDLYLTAGITYIRLEGPGAAVFGSNQIDVAKLASSNQDPSASMTALQIGLEAHVKYRFGFSTFIEYIPVLEGNQIIAEQHLLVPYHSIGFAGVLLW